MHVCKAVDAIRLALELPVAELGQLPTWATGETRCLMENSSPHVLPASVQLGPVVNETQYSKFADGIYIDGINSVFQNISNLLLIVSVS